MMREPLFQGKGEIDQIGQVRFPAVKPKILSLS